jgi:hypothetical protein
MPMNDDLNHRGSSRRWIVATVVTLSPADNGWGSPALDPAARRR